MDNEQSQLILSVKHSRFTGKNFQVNGEYVSKKHFFAILIQHTEAQEWVRLHRMLELFAALLGLFGTVLLILAILLKIKAVNGLAFVLLVASVLQYVMATVLSLRADKALGKAVEVFNKGGDS